MCCWIAGEEDMILFLSEADSFLLAIPDIFAAVTLTENRAKGGNYPLIFNACM